MASSSENSVGGLGKDIAAYADTIQNFVSSSGVTLSFDANASPTFPTDAPENVLEARRKLLDATKTLRDLVLGPTEQVFRLACTYVDYMVLQWICHFRIVHHVPLDGSIAYESLAKECGIDASRLRRVLRMGMLLQVLCEPEPDRVAHSASSRLMATDPGVEAMVSVLIEDFAPAGTKSAAAYEKFGNSGEPTHSGWNLENNVKDEVCYLYWAKNNVKKGDWFSTAMKRFNDLEGWGIEYLLTSYEWASLPQGSKIVDVGGGLGPASITLAKAYPHLKFVVQDLEQNTEEGRKALPAGLEGNVEFMTHDFFTEQPIKDADIYFFQDVLIDYPDDTAARVVEKICNVMKPGSKLIVRDGVLPEPGSWNSVEEHELRALDLTAMVMTNAGHRDLPSWKKMFQMGNPKAEVKKVNRPPGSLYSVMVVELE